MNITPYANHLVGKYWHNKPVNNESGHKHITKQHKWIINKETGLEEWKECGSIDFNLIIQANAKDTDMATIAKQVLNGNTAILNAKNGIYCDTSILPSNIHEAHAMAEKLSTLYENNPILQKIYANKELYEKDFVAGKVPEAIDKFHKATQEEIAKKYAKMREEEAKKSAEFDNLKNKFKEQK